MLPFLRKNFLDHAANVLTIFVALVFFGLLLQRYVFVDTPEPEPAPKVGNEVKINGFVPVVDQKNVLLVLMKGCRFCEESAPFYRDLIARSAGRDHKILVVFPNETKEANSYISGLGLGSLDVIYSPLADLDVPGTPTIIVTDGTGRILASWVGKLTKDKQGEVFDFLAL